MTEGQAARASSQVAGGNVQDSAPTCLDLGSWDCGGVPQRAQLLLMTQLVR